MDIFLLEDDEAIGIGLTYSLENEGYNVTLAKSVKEAEKIIDENKFSLYILACLTEADMTFVRRLKKRVTCLLSF